MAVLPNGEGSASRGNSFILLSTQPDTLTCHLKPSMSERPGPTGGEVVSSAAQEPSMCTPLLVASPCWRSFSSCYLVFRVSSSPKKSRNAPPIDQGLPLPEAFGQPAVWEQACLGQDCRVAGGQGVSLGSDRSWQPRTQVPTWVPWDFGLDAYPVL